MPTHKWAHLTCTHSALALCVFMGIALLMIGWVPPPSPALSAEQTALMFRDNANSVRFAALMMLLGGTFYWLFSVAVFEQMKRMESPHSHPLATAQLVCSTGTVLAIVLPAMLWLVAAFRPERSPEVTQLAYDLSWMMFIGMIPPALFQVLLLALCVFLARPGQQVFPRWFGFFNVWIATAFMAGEFVGFFQHGPFAWDGVIAFWLAAVTFFGWVLLTWWLVFRAVLAMPVAAERPEALQEAVA